MKSKINLGLFINVKLYFTWNVRSLKEMLSCCFMIAWYLEQLTL